VLFPTVEFAVFFAVVFVGSWLLRPRPTAWKLFSLAASYFFYGWWDWGFLWLLALLTVANQLFASGAHRAGGDRARKGWVTVAVVFDLAILGWFKYYGFFVENLSELAGTVGIDWAPPLLTVVLPIGISFIVFQAISYVVDCSRRTIRPATLLDFGVYLTYFPHVLAGPLVRASEFIPQLHEPADPRRIDASRAFRLVVQGMFKKVVVASFLASAIVDPVFANPQSHSSLETLVAIYAYAFVIYCDFSGYTDIAIGIALLLGIRFPQNFDAPYTARSVQEFWRRWHMTLSRWLRDYLYVGLGGNRYGRLKTYRNLFLTMLIGGFWHGADWTFVLWGAIHGGALVVERLRSDRRRDAGIEVAATPGRAVLQWLVTFNVVCLAWVFFRSRSVDVAFDVLRQLVVAWGEPSPLVTPLVVLTVVAMLASQFVPERYPERVQIAFSRAAPAVQGLALAGCFFLIDALGPTGVAPFIYFQF
jgi:alginate O-acetyltransferase complex protein AlgI